MNLFFAWAKTCGFTLMTAYIKEKRADVVTSELLLINSLDVSAPAFEKNDATILFTTLLLHILHMYVSSRSINVNSCTKSRREWHTLWPLQGTLTRTEFWERMTLGELCTRQKEKFIGMLIRFVFIGVKWSPTIIVSNHALDEEPNRILLSIWNIWTFINLHWYFSIQSLWKWPPTSSI